MKERIQVSNQNLNQKLTEFHKALTLALPLGVNVSLTQEPFTGNINCKMTTQQGKYQDIAISFKDGYASWGVVI